MSHRLMQDEIEAMTLVDLNRPYGFPWMKCDPKVRAIAANERAIYLGYTPENIRRIVIQELAEIAA